MRIILSCNIINERQRVTGYNIDIFHEYNNSNNSIIKEVIGCSPLISTGFS